MRLSKSTFGVAILFFVFCSAAFAQSVDKSCWANDGWLDLSRDQCVADGHAFLPDSLSKRYLWRKPPAAKKLYRVGAELEQQRSLDDKRLAVAWYQLAVDAGFEPAIYALAATYELGELVQSDLAKAHKLYSSIGATKPLFSTAADDTSSMGISSIDIDQRQARLESARRSLEQKQKLSRLYRDNAQSQSRDTDLVEALEFELLAADYRIKRAKKALAAQRAKKWSPRLALLREEIQTGAISDQSFAAINELTQAQQRQLGQRQRQLQRDQQRIAQIRKAGSSGPAGSELDVLAMTSQEQKDQALKKYLRELEGSVQHRKVTQNREQKKLDFLQKRINKLKRQTKRTIKTDDQVLLERALTQMDNRYQGQLSYLADNLKQEMDHASVLKQDIKALQKQSKNDRQLVSTITKRLEDTADLVEKQSALVDRQSQDLKLAIDKMNEVHAKPIKAAAMWMADAPAPAKINIKWPEYKVNGDDWVVESPAGATLRLVGAATGMASLRVDGAPVELDKQGLFMANVDVFDDTVWLALEGTDLRGQKVVQRVRIEPQRRPVTRLAKQAKAALKDLGDIDFGNYHALVFGNNLYGTTGFETLDTAVNDAESMAALLKQKYGFSVDVVLNATRDQMIEAMEKTRKKLTELDNLLIYYAGHGIMDAESNQGYWVPVDGAVNSTKRWISNATITDQIRGMTARNVMVVADSCYSGSLMRSGMMYVRSGLTPEKKVKRVSEDVASATRVVLSSGGLQPVIDSIDGNPNSVFTSAMLENLKSNDGLLDADSLATAVSHAVAMATADTVKQVPRFAPLIRAGHEGGEFYFVPNSWRQKGDGAE